MFMKTEGCKWRCWWPLGASSVQVAAWERWQLQIPCDGSPPHTSSQRSVEEPWPATALLLFQLWPPRVDGPLALPWVSLLPRACGTGTFAFPGPDPRCSVQPGRWVCL